MSDRTAVNEPFLLAAGAVMPLPGTPLSRGGVVISGDTIMRLGPLAELRREFPGIRAEVWDRCVLLPGLVNAHCHLELSTLRGRLPPGHFADWVKGLLACNMAVDDVAAEVSAAVRIGVAESLRGGVTCLGDITKRVACTRAALRDAPLRVVSFGEISALGTRRTRLDESLREARRRDHASALLRVGLSPHAPYTVEGPALRTIMAAARDDGLPVCMHLAELPEEAEFLATLGGRLREAWDIAGTAHEILDDRIPRFPGGPVRWAKHYGLLEPPGQTKAGARPGATHARVPVVLAHVNYADDQELEIIRAAEASVVYCPRTRAFFGHEAAGPHRFREMLQQGINVALGTDSLASNPDLSLLREGQLVRRLHPDVPAETLLEMMTLRPAHALGMADRIGSLAPVSRPISSPSSCPSPPCRMSAASPRRLSS